MGRVILIAGLPGSGKTKYGKELKPKVKAVEYLDDYHANAIGGSPDFDKGRQFRKLINGLIRGETWIASDIEWCRPERRRCVDETIRNEVPGVCIEWHFVAIDEVRCRQRVTDRARKKAMDELAKVDELSRSYHIPPTAKIAPSTS